VNKISKYISVLPKVHTGSRAQSIQALWCRDAMLSTDLHPAPSAATKHVIASTGTSSRFLGPFCVLVVQRIGQYRRHCLCVQWTGDKIGKDLEGIVRGLIEVLSLWNHSRKRRVKTGQGSWCFVRDYSMYPPFAVVSKMCQFGKASSGPRRNKTNEMHIQCKVNYMFRILVLLLHVSALYERHLQGAQKILMKLCVCYVISAE
jgi:hypothetical protein